MIPGVLQQIRLYGKRGVASVVLMGLVVMSACGSSGKNSLTTDSPRQAAPAPTISSISPTSGPAAGGTTVTITGTNFQSVAAVTFGGAAAASIPSVRSTQLSAVTPRGNTGAVNVVVSNPDGESATLTNGFTYTSPSSSSIQIIRSLPDGYPQVPYHATLVAYAGVQSLSNLVPLSNWMITSGSLPPGLNLKSSTGVIQGIPSAAGASGFSVQGTSSGGQTTTANLTIDIASPASNAPALPKTFLDTTYPDTAGYVVKTVCVSGCDYTTVQSAVDGVHNVGGDANGEIIKLASGVTFTENVTLPAYTMVPGKWVIITTNTDPSNLPAEGQRISPSYSPVLAKIVTNNSSYAVGAASKANHYWLMGLEIEVSPSVKTNYGIVTVGCACETSSAQLPSFIYIDRCYVHGNNLSSNVSRGVSANGASVAVVNSYISAITNTGQDCQAVEAWNSPGPIKLVNNYLEAATENIMFGGADPSIANLVPRDVEIRHNWLFKPLAWDSSSPTYGGVHQVVKDLLEFKNADRVLVEGNVLDQNWGGYGVLFTPRNQGGSCLWCLVSNITFEYNLLEHSQAGYNISGGDSGPPNSGGPSLPAEYIAIRNNLNLDISASGRLFQILNGGVTTNPSPPPNNITLDHNTSYQPIGAVFFGDNSSGTADIAPFTFTNNVQPGGIGGTGIAPGTQTLKAYCGSSGYIVRANIFQGQGSTYPSGNSFPKDWSTVFMNFAQGDYHILPTSPYHNAGTDGKDLGADIDAVVSSIAGSVP